MENQEVFQFGTKLIPDKGWEYRGVYDVGNTVAHRKDLINQVPTMTQPQDTTTNKIRYERQIFDFNGNNILQEYFDNKGQLLEIDGVATVVRAWDFNGEKTLEETYDKDKKLIDKDGFARYTAVYKSKGNPISENWYGKNGEYANNKSGYARIHSIYDEQGRLTKKLFYDKDSKLVGGKWGVATYTYSYNPDCIRFYESQLFAKDEEGDEDPNKEQSRTEWKLGKYRLCLAEEIHTDKEGKPAGDEKKIYKKLRTFNTKGFLVSEENYRPDDERRHLENGVAKVVYSHDENGNIISRKNFGEFEIGIQNAELRIKNEESETTGEKPVEKKEPVPVSDGNGVHEYRYTYQEYFSYDGKPILNECMHHRKDKGILIEPYGCAIKIEHYGINGKPIEDKRNVFRTNFYYTGAYQVEADRHYYSLYNRSLWVETEATIASNPFGSQTLSAYYETKKGKEVFVNKHEYKYDERNNMTLEAKYETKEGALVLVWKREYKYDERNKKTLYTDYETKEGKEIMVSKHEYKYDESITLVANYETKEGALVLVRKEEYKYGKRNNGLAHLSTEILSYETKEGTLVLFRKEEYEYDERNNVTLVANYETKEGKEVLILKREFKYDEKNNQTLYAFYETKEGKEVLVMKTENNFDERNNKTLYAYYVNKEGKEVLVSKTESKYDEKNKMALEAKYETKEGKEVLLSKSEYKYDERNNVTIEEKYQTKEGALVLVWKREIKYDERNNKTLDAYYVNKEGKEVLVKKTESKYNEKNKMTLEAKYETEEGKEVLVRKTESKYDGKNNKIFYARYTGEEETIQEKSTVDYRLVSYTAAVTQYEPEIKQLEEKLYQTKDESEKKSLNQKLEDLKKEFEAKRKKYTLTEEKFGENEKLESASYKLLFFNPRCPADKRLMRVDLDRFYRPVKAGFEEE